MELRDRFVVWDICYQTFVDIVNKLDSNDLVTSLVDVNIEDLITTENGYARFLSNSDTINYRNTLYNYRNFLIVKCGLNNIVGISKNLINRSKLFSNFVETDVSDEQLDVLFTYLLVTFAKAYVYTNK